MSSLWWRLGGHVLIGVTDGGSRRWLGDLGFRDELPKCERHPRGGVGWVNRDIVFPLFLGVTGHAKHSSMGDSDTGFKFHGE